MKKIRIVSGVDGVAILSLEKGNLRQRTGGVAPPLSISFHYPEVIEAVDNIIENDTHEPREFTSQAEILAYNKNGFNQEGSYYVFTS